MILQKNCVNEGVKFIHFFNKNNINWVHKIVLIVLAMYFSHSVLGQTEAQLVYKDIKSFFMPIESVG